MGETSNTTIFALIVIEALLTIDIKSSRESMLLPGKTTISEDDFIKTSLIIEDLKSLSSLDSHEE